MSISSFIKLVNLVVESKLVEVSKLGKRLDLCCNVSFSTAPQSPQTNLSFINALNLKNLMTNVCMVRKMLWLSVSKLFFKYLHEEDYFFCKLNVCALCECVNTQESAHESRPNSFKDRHVWMAQFILEYLDVTKAGSPKNVNQGETQQQRRVDFSFTIDVRRIHRHFLLKQESFRSSLMASQSHRSTTYHSSFYHKHSMAAKKKHALNENLNQFKRQNANLENA